MGHVAQRGIIGAGLILLALWLQALAPAAALRAMALAADPVAHAVICGPSGAETDPDEPAQQAPHAACQLCGLCAAGLTGAILPAAPPALAAPSWRIAAAWPIPPPPARIVSDHPPGQPRAPPASV